MSDGSTKKTWASRVSEDSLPIKTIATDPKHPKHPYSESLRLLNGPNATKSRHRKPKKHYVETKTPVSDTEDTPAGSSANEEEPVVVVESAFSSALKKHVQQLSPPPADAAPVVLSREQEQQEIIQAYIKGALEQNPGLTCLHIHVGSQQEQERAVAWLQKEVPGGPKSVTPWTSYGLHLQLNGTEDEIDWSASKTHMETQVYPDGSRVLRQEPSNDNHCLHCFPLLKTKQNQ